MLLGLRVILQYYYLYINYKFSKDCIETMNLDFVDKFCNQ